MLRTLLTALYSLTWGWGLFLEGDLGVKEYTYVNDYTVRGIGEYITVLGCESGTIICVIRVFG